MFGTLKRWFSTQAPADDWTAVVGWARPRAFAFKRVKDESGFVVDGHFDGSRPWRLEWGAPQRSYIGGQELRLRMDLNLPNALQLLVLSRPLMETLEKDTFDQYTLGTQTAIDMSSPEEMRWLAMFPRISVPHRKSLRAMFAGVGSDTALATAWLSGPLADALLQASQTCLASQPPFVLMSLRGRMCLRMRLDAPDPVVLTQVLNLFELACQTAAQLRLAGSGLPPSVVSPAGAHHSRASEWSSTATSVWHSQLHAEAETLPAASGH